MRKIENIHWNRWILTIITLGFFLLSWAQAAAQSGIDLPWSIPVNLSKSGAVADPQLLQDAAGNLHIFWRDDISGTAYVSGDVDNWADPIFPVFPFSDPPFSTVATSGFVGYFTADLFIDQTDRVHAIWRDGDNLLYYSRSNILEIGTGSSGWTFPVEITSALKADLVVDANGRLHLTYIFPKITEDIQPGIVYRFSDDAGVTWSDPQSLYQSNYLRDVIPDEARLMIAAAEEGYLFVAWEDPGFERLYFTRSSDSGESWSDPLVVDQRRLEDPADAASPRRITIGSNENGLLLTWHAAHGETGCGQYVQQSTDQGENWSDPQLVIDGGSDCPLDGQIIFNSQNDPFLFTHTETDAYLQAFDGEIWSLPLPQRNLFSFVDPQTYNDTAITCHHFVLNEANRLFSLNCGSGKVDDIWFQWRPLRPASQWTNQFEPTPIWRAPQQLVRSNQILRPPRMILAADILHAIWSQSENPIDNESLTELPPLQDSTVYYSRYDEETETWFSGRPVLNTPGGTRAENPDLAADDEGVLFAVWSGDQPDGIFFSRVEADLATSRGEWETPLLLPAPRAGGDWPSMKIGENDSIYVAYAIPANENRGIYLTISTNDGNSWGEAIQVFDGTAAGWAMVGKPHLVIAPGGALHLLWEQLSAPPAAAPTALVYARSTDGGLSWTAPEIVAEETVFQSDLLAVDGQLLHRVWVSADNGRTLTWTQTTQDGGISWSEARRLLAPDVLTGSFSLIQDQVRRPIIMQLGETADGSLILLEWLWVDGNWLAGDRRLLGDNVVKMREIEAIAGPGNQIGVLFGGIFTESEEDVLVDTLVYTRRDWSVDLESAPTPLPTPTATPTMPPTSTPPVEPTPSPTPTLAPVATPSPLASSSGGLIVGAGITLLLVSVAFIFGLRRMRSR